MEDFEKFSEITINEHVESKRVKKRYYQAIEETKFLVVVPMIITLIFTVLFLLFLAQEEHDLSICFLVLTIISIITYFICKAIRENKISFYKELYRIARRNDQIRYDEKIRYLERKRLDLRFDNVFNKKNVKETINYSDELDK